LALVAFAAVSRPAAFSLATSIPPPITCFKLPHLAAHQPPPIPQTKCAASACVKTIRAGWGHLVIHNDNMDNAQTKDAYKPLYMHSKLHFKYCEILFQNALAHSVTFGGIWSVF
jgi:hypothetical protein